MTTTTASVPTKARIGALADSRSLCGLSGRVSLVGGLLGSGQISKRSLLFVSECLGVGLCLIGHLGLRCLLSLGSLQRSGGLGGVRLGRFGSSREGLSLLDGLNLCGLSGLDSLGCLRCLGRFGESGRLSCLRGLRDLSCLRLFGSDDGLGLLRRLRCLGSELRLGLLGRLSGSTSLCVLGSLCLVSRLLSDRSCATVSYSVAPSTSTRSGSVSATTAATSVATREPTFALVKIYIFC